MKTFTVEVTHQVEVTIDETKFTPEFMTKFSFYIWPAEGIEDHVKHLAQMHVTGNADCPQTFIEGYGTAESMGISFKTTDRQAEIID